ncbi:MAG: hypothetical protein ACOC56_04880 [Atribacterota bacterium]
MRDSIQQWEGTIVAIKEDTVFVAFTDITEPSNGIEIMELPIKKIPESDRKFIELGSILYWSIFLEGKSDCVSKISIRKNPKWSKKIVKEIKKEASELTNSFDQEKENGL